MKNSCSACFENQYTPDSLYRHHTDIGVQNVTIVKCHRKQRETAQSFTLVDQAVEVEMGRGGHQLVTLRTTGAKYCGACREDWHTGVLLTNNFNTTTRF